MFKMVAGVDKWTHSYLRHPKPKGLYRSDCQYIWRVMWVYGT